MSNELLPCPFCGGEATSTINFPTQDLISVSCENKNCMVHPHTVALNLKEAFERWNTRVTLPNEPLTLEQLKQMSGNPVWCEFETSSCCAILHIAMDGDMIFIFSFVRERYEDIIKCKDFKGFYKNKPIIKENQHENIRK